MTLRITTALQNSNPDPPLTHARIGYKNIARDGTVSASSEQSNFPATAAENELTFERWKPDALPATWQVDFGSDTTVNYCGIAAHSLGENGNQVEVEHSSDGNTWTTIDTFSPSDDSPIMVLFTDTSDQYWRIRLSSGTIPVVGVIFFGQTLDMERAIYGGHSPLPLSRTTTVRPQRSEGGQWLGRSVVRKGFSTNCEWDNLTASWYRANFDPFAKYATQEEGAFFIAWRPDDYDEVGYCWTGGDIQPTNTGTRDLMSVSMDVTGHSDV